MSAPPNDERRPRQEAASVAGGPTPSFARRRVASLRCEPLADGRRDPWRYEPTPASRHALAASRDAWSYLAWLGLVDSEGFVEGILRDLGRAS